jgi:hypothetical protein
MGKNSTPKQKDRRSRYDRRQFTFTLHIPERRSGKDRRQPALQEDKSKTVITNPASKKKAS